MLKSNFSYIKILFLILLITTPWLNADYSDDINPAVPSQEDMSFYEINPCEVSLLEFIRKVPTSIYQDHYHFRYNNYSSISCFGKISGATVLNNEFYISVGTNSFVNIVIQTLFWITIFSFIKKEFQFKIDKNKVIALCATSGLITYSIISEARFYEQSFYFFDFEKNIHVILLTFFIFISSLHVLRVVEPRIYEIINYLPYIFIIGGVYSGFNISIYLFILIFFGFIFLLSSPYKKSLIYFLFFSPILFFWSTNADVRYSFKTDKLRGFINSSYDFNSNLAWSALFILTLMGIFFIYKNTLDYVNFEKIYSSFNISVLLLLILGLFGSNFPLINFINYYYFGQQKYGISLNNPFASDVYDQKIAWRGVFSSSEFAGEIFALFLIFTIYIYFSQHNFKIFYYVGITGAIFGLYFSNNRASLTLLIFTGIILYLKYNSHLKNKKYIVGAFLTFFLIFIAWLVGFNNFTYSLEFMQNYTFGKAQGYDVNGNTSSLFQFISYSKQTNNIFSFVFGIIGVLSFFLNRALMWGLFIVRYNPNFLELILGTGPMSFGKYFGEIKVDGINSLLLPHSSVFSYLIFIGLLGLLFIFGLIIYSIKKNKENLSTFSYLLFIYILFNIIKSDSLLYIHAIIFYFHLVFIFIKINNSELLNLPNKEISAN
mgnify:CR=1 FL=1